MTSTPRCAVEADARQESMVGTASTATRFLLLEDPGPWGVDALRDARMPPPVKRELAAQATENRVRVVLIRRHGRTVPGQLRCFAVSASAPRPWVETTTLDEVKQVLDIDLTRLGADRSVGLEPYDAPLFLVCTHGRHDRCCAERGRPLAQRMSRTHPEQTWECSHIGGDRFAGNLVILPYGLYYGRVDADTGPRIVAAYREGRLDLAHLRGRVTSRFATQAAEWHLRSTLGLVGIDDVRPVRDRLSDGGLEAWFRVSEGETWRVRLSIGRTEPERLTCQSSGMSLAPTYELLDVTRWGLAESADERRNGF